MKVLIIEDDPRIADVVSVTIKIRWPKALIIATKTGKEGINLAAKEEPSLIILDLGLPDIDGLEVLRQIKSFSNIPIFILSVRDEEADVVEGLEMGADEYVTKPFRQMEFLSRVQCILRKQHIENDGEPFLVGPLHFMPAKRRLIYEGREITLTMTENIMLEKLIRNVGRHVSTVDLAQSVWGADYPGSAEAIHVYIRRLRQKVEIEPNHPQIIKNVPGLGYILQLN